MTRLLRWMVGFRNKREGAALFATLPRWYIWLAHANGVSDPLTEYAERMVDRYSEPGMRIAYATFNKRRQIYFLVSEAEEALS